MAVVEMTMDAHDLAPLLFLIPIFIGSVIITVIAWRHNRRHRR